MINKHICISPKDIFNPNLFSEKETSKTRSRSAALEPEALRALKMGAAMVNEEPSALLSRVVMDHFFSGETKPFRGLGSHHLLNEHREG